MAGGSRYDGTALGPNGRGPIPHATIAVLTQPANTSTQPGSPLATIYTDATLTTTTANPFQADVLGNFHFYADSSLGPFTVQVYGPQVQTPYVLADQGMPSIPGSTASLSKLDGIYFVDGLTYAQTAAGVNAAITAANAAGGGHVIVPASFTAQAQIVLKSNVYVHSVNGAIITAGSSLPAGTTVVSANTITDAGFWGVIDGASLTNVADGFDLVSCSRFWGSVDVRNTGKRVGVDWGVYINACTDVYLELVRVRNHGEGTNGTNGVYITGSNSNVVIDKMDVDGTICQAGNGNIKVDGSGVHVEHVIATNPTGPVGNLQTGDGIIITATDSSFGLIETSNNSSGAKGASNVTIQGAAARLNFGVIVSENSTGNGIEINSGATNTIQDIRIGTAFVRNAGRGGAVSNQAAFEVIGNAQISKNITVGSLHAIDDQGVGATSKYAVLLQQSAGGAIDEVSIGRVHAVGMTTANVSTSGTITNFSYSLPEMHYATSASTAGVVLRQKSTAVSGRDWALGSNFTVGAGEWGIFDYTAVKERFRLDSTGLAYVKRLTANFGTVLTAGDIAVSGWGTGAAVSAVTGTDQGFDFTITAGTTPGANPTITPTFKDGTWSLSPILVIMQRGGTGAMPTQITYTPSATAPVITWVGTPVNTLTYIFSVIVMGR